MDQLYGSLLAGMDVRSNLSALRAEMKSQGREQDVCEWIAQNEATVLGFLGADDAKTRKNAALLLGDAGYEPAAEALWEAYQKEETLFVKSAYPQALGNLRAGAYLNGIKARIAELSAAPDEEENRKHTAQELRALRNIVIRYEGIPGHTFDAKGAEVELLLVTNRMHREIVRRSVTCGTARLHPLGVSVITRKPKDIWQVRSFREVLFPIQTKPAMLPADPKQIAAALSESDIVGFLERLHLEEGPFYYRIEYKSRMTLEERSVFSRKLSDELERLTGGSLINAPGGYEVELRLIENGKGEFFPCVRFLAFEDHRFDYRKNAIAASIHPSTAALLMELSVPYLKEDAQIIDPFCGVGTMLIERNLAVGAREMYATDIFGEAVEKGRENAALAGAHINFIHRNFFDFSHDYPFDEFITNMPVRGKKTKEEAEAIYEGLFDRVLALSAPEATMILYTNEVGFVKKQIRLRKQFTLKQETCIRQKTGFYLLIIGVAR